MVYVSLLILRSYSSFLGEYQSVKRNVNKKVILSCKTHTFGFRLCFTCNLVIPIGLVRPLVPFRLTIKYVGYLSSFGYGRFIRRFKPVLTVVVKGLLVVEQLPNVVFGYKGSYPVSTL